MTKAGAAIQTLLLGALAACGEAAAPKPYADFTPHHASMTCTKDRHTYPFNNQLRGVNLGGWLVLEPWITPSLFYQAR